MKAKKLFSVLLAALMVSVCFTACGGDDETTTASNAPADTAVVDSYFVPDTKLEGEFTVLTNTDDGEWTNNNFFVEEDSDDPVNSAVYRRQKLIEETFGIKFKVIEGVTRGSINDYVSTSVKSGTKDYDLVVNSINHMYTLAQSDCLTPIDEITHLDTSIDSWDQSMLAQTSIAGTNYFATGDITVVDNDATWVMMFNKNLARSVGIGEGDLKSIYDLVKDNEWTLDKLLEYCKLFTYQDLDQSGTTTHLDQFPIATTVDFITGLYYGTNSRIIHKDAADIPYLKELDDTTVKLVNKVAEIYTASNQYTFDCHDYMSIEPSVHLLAQRMFEEDRALFYSEVMQCVTRLRDMDTDFGIIPVPKADQNQANYTTHSVSIVTMVAGVPKDISYDEERLARSGMIMQALAVEGKNILTPAYYEASLIGKGTRDEESADMLPIIFANRVVDLGSIVDDDNITSISNSLIDAIKSNSTNKLASLFARNKTKVNAALTDLVEKFNEVE